MSKKPENNALTIRIGEGKGIYLELPVALQPPAAEPPLPAVPTPEAPVPAKPENKDIVKRSLKNLSYRIRKVEIGEETKIQGDTLTLRSALAKEAIKEDPHISDVSFDIITPDNRNIYTNTMMDICPIAAKLDGKLGTGTTYEVTGAVMMLTGTDAEGKQVSDANSSDGILAERVKFGRPGCPDEDDIIIRIHVVIKEGFRMERPGPFGAHKAADYIVEEIRQELKKIPAENAEEVRIYEDIERVGRPRVLAIKEIMGQGAMHDNLILPVEPAGFFGGQPNVDLGNLPIMLTPNEVRDGGIHALTCITPATKETTRHYWREPLVHALAEDEEFDLVGVLFVGSPQANVEKFYVSERLGRLVEALKLDGAIITTEGFGNNHVDFSSHIEQIGSLGIPVVGMSYCGVQGALVTGNKYMDALIDLSVSKDGVESDILEENTITPEAALRAICMLKDKMMGVPIKKAENKWNLAVQEQNLEYARESHKK